MTNQVPGVAVVGCGTWGKNLVRNFYEQGALRFIYDPDRDCASQILQQYPVRSASSFDDLLSEPSVHAIVISAPAVRHFELAKKVLLAGKDVFVEKPLALCSEDAQELIALAETHSRVLMVGHLLLFHPVVLRLQKMIHSGDLGKVQYVYSSRLNLELRAARHLGAPLLAQGASPELFGAWKQLPQFGCYRHHALDIRFLQRRQRSYLCQLAASFQGTEAGGGGRPQNGGVR